MMHPFFNEINFQDFNEYYKTDKMAPSLQKLMKEMEILDEILCKNKPLYFYLILL